MKKIDPNSKLKNIKALNQMLRGEHRSQTKTVVGYNKKENKKQREVGEVWEEIDPSGSVIIWEQKKGYRVKRRKNLRSLYDLQDYINSYSNCHKDVCDAKGTRLDKKFQKLTGRCADCHFKFERQLKKEGKFEEYASNYMSNRIKGFLKEAEQEKEAIKMALENVSFPNEDGSEDKFEVTNKKSLIDKIDKDFEDLKNSLIKGMKKDLGVNE